LCPHDYADGRTAGINKSRGKLIAKEPFPHWNFVAFAQEMGCQFSAFVAFENNSAAKTALQATSNVGVIFLFFF
jgi:hypothetical protein